MLGRKRCGRRSVVFREVRAAQETYFRSHCRCFEAVGAVGGLAAGWRRADREGRGVSAAGVRQGGGFNGL